MLALWQHITKIQSVDGQFKRHIGYGPYGCVLYQTNRHWFMLLFSRVLWRFCFSQQLLSFEVLERLKATCINRQSSRGCTNEQTRLADDRQTDRLRRDRTDCPIDQPPQAAEMVRLGDSTEYRPTYGASLLVNPFKPSGAKWLQSVQSHTGLTHHFYFFDVRALWRSVLSARVPERQENKNGGLDQYGFEHFVV